MFMNFETHARSGPTHSSVIPPFKFEDDIFDNLLPMEWNFKFEVMNRETLKK